MGANAGYKPNCQFLVLFLFISLFLSSCLDIMRLCLGDGNASFKYMEREREALLAFKEGVTDPSGRLSSWVGEDCCRWRGIGCDNQTGHVTKINLRNQFRSRDSIFVEDVVRNTCLGGKINPSLLQLEQLNYLDLSLNHFQGLQIPKFFGMLKNLRYLNLASASFSGEIPSQIGNLSRLQHLDLYAYQDFQLTAKSLHWLSSLSSLKYLNLGSVNLYNTATGWLEAINKLPSLLELHLPGCDLENRNLDLPVVNFTSLVTLNMTSNFYKTSIPRWLSNLTGLTILDLSLNYLTGPLLTKIGSFCNLEILDFSVNEFRAEPRELLGLFTDCPVSRLVSLNLRSSKLVGELPKEVGLLNRLRFLDLSANFLWGSIPTSIGKLSSLKILDLSYNTMNGTIPESLGQLSELVELHLHSNNWNCVLTEAHFRNLTRLRSIRLTTDPPMSLAFNVSYDWVPPFKLENIDIQNCMVGPAFAVWLQTQHLLISVVLQNTGLADRIPKEWFSSIASQLTFLDLSNNQIKGELPHQLVSPNLTAIDLSANRFEGSIPLWSTNAKFLYLQDNQFSGAIPDNIGELMPSLLQIDLSGNLLNGSIPLSVCKMQKLSVLSLRSNRLSGQLPDCWDKMQDLWALDVSNNSISGKIPRSIGYLTSLHVLLLSNNDHEGEIPDFLQNCSALMTLDLGGNRFSGNLPTWMGESLSSLLILLLGSNFFTGKIPPEFCSLSYLHFLDLSHNNISGNIPRCFNKLNALVNGSYDIYHDVQMRYGINYDGRAVIRTKGRELEYGRTLVLVNGIDLSGNNLSGRIPDEISSLSLLGILNLSMNRLSGSIPRDIGNIRWLETLDLSRNHLSGPIPQSLSSLTSLNHLNLSDNNLEGRIPSGYQLQTLNDSSIYKGNPLLCGVPLPTRCAGDDPSSGPTRGVDGAEDKQDEDHWADVWFYVSVVGGFIAGFWSVCGTLVLKRSWRHAYFKFLEDTTDRIAIMVALKVVHLRRKFGWDGN